MARIYQRSDIWYVDFQYNGRRLRKKIGKSKRMAEFALKDIEVKIIKDELGILRKEIKIDKFLDDYLTYIEVNKRKKTAVRYREIIKHFRKFIHENGLVKLSEITPVLIEKYKQQRLNFIKPVTVNYEIVFLKAVFNQAAKNNYLKKNPFDEIEKLKVTPKQPKFFTKEELRQIFIYCGQRFYPIFLTFASTGMRLGELINLEWNDIDLERRLIYIRVKDFWEPKNSQPRSIPMPDKLLEVLSELNKDTMRVFMNRNAKKLKR